MDAPPNPPGRIRIPDPALMRHGAWRTGRAGIILLILLTGFTVGGINLLRIGELPGLPFAAGGATAQLTVITINIATLRIRWTLHDDTVSRQALQAAQTVFALLRPALLVVISALAIYALARLIIGDPWTLLTTTIISIVLWLLSRGSKRLGDGLDAQLTTP